MSPTNLFVMADSGFQELSFYDHFLVGTDVGFVYTCSLSSAGWFLKPRVCHYEQAGGTHLLFIAVWDRPLPAWNYDLTIFDKNLTESGSQKCEIMLETTIPSQSMKRIVHASVPSQITRHFGLHFYLCFVLSFSQLFIHFLLHII